MGGSGKNFNRANWDPEQASPDNPGNPAPYVPTTTYQPFGSGTLSGTGGTNVYHPDPYTGQPDIAASNPADVERDRQRQIGDDMARRQAVQLNFGAADQDRQNNLGARNTQIEAGNMMRTAAVGGAPSRAAIEANTVGDQSLEAQLGAGAGQRGPATGLQSAAATGAVGLQLQGANTAGLGRSGETNRALLSYGQNTGTMRKGDYTQQQLDQRQAEAQAQQQLEQNARNQNGQMGMERLGLGTEKAAMDLSNREADLNNAAANNTQSNQIQNTERTRKIVKGAEDMLPSDARVKQKAALPGLAAKGRELMAQTNANRDSLRYGPSVRRVSDGDASNGYNTELTSGAERSYQEHRRALYGDDSGDDYDYRGAFAYGEGRDAGGHMTDRFKKPNHPTFSNESQYATDPDKAGSWKGERFTPGKYQGVDEGDVNRIRYGHEPYRGDMFKRAIDEESNRENLHKGIEARLQRDADRPAERAEDERAQLAKEHAEAPRGYDLGSGYSDDPNKHYGASPGNTYAPGTEDWLQYGKPRTMMQPKEGTNPNDYIDGQAPMDRVDAPMDPYSKAVSLSDEDAKKPSLLERIKNAGSSLRDSLTGARAEEKPMQREPRTVESATPPRALITDVSANQKTETMSNGAVVRGLPMASQKEAKPSANPGPMTGTLTKHNPEAERPAASTTVERTSDEGAKRASSPLINRTSETSKLRNESLRKWGEHAEENYNPRGPMPPPVRGSGMSEDQEDMNDPTPSDDDSVQARRLQQDANRKLVGSTYTYKDGIGEDPNQIHHGQMAQTMEENPITATAVRNDPNGGFKRVSEFDKLNVTAAGVAELQHQQDEMAAELEKLRGRRRRTA